MPLSERRPHAVPTPSDIAPPPPRGQGATLHRLWRRLARGLGALGLGWASVAMPAPAQDVPQHWLRYAALTSRQLEASLSDPASEAVQRLHSWMQERLLKEAQPQLTPLVVRLWVAPSGQVEHAAFDALGNAQADADLRGLLGAQRMAEPPPADMRQPMVLQLTLDFINRS